MEHKNDRFIVWNVTLAAALVWEQKDNTHSVQT